MEEIVDIDFIRKNIRLMPGYYVSDIVYNPKKEQFAEFLLKNYGQNIKAYQYLWDAQFWPFEYVAPTVGAVTVIPMGIN